MDNPQFGKLVRKEDLRDFWPNEATDFTPWLASEENLPLLGDAIGLELEPGSYQVPIGPYSADIVCRSIPDGHRVVIENQLERTDHDHLGKLLTYAAGLGDISTVVWIASDFTEQHRAALDWLNRSTTQDVGFFGLAIEVWQIGDSLPAPPLHPRLATQRLVKAFAPIGSDHRSGNAERVLDGVQRVCGFNRHEDEG